MKNTIKSIFSDVEVVPTCAVCGEEVIDGVSVYIDGLGGVICKEHDIENTEHKEYENLVLIHEIVDSAKFKNAYSDFVSNMHDYSVSNRSLFEAFHRATTGVTKERLEEFISEFENSK